MICILSLVIYRGLATPLFDAIEHRDLGKIRTLISKSADVNIDLGETPLSFAAMGGNIEVVKVLVELNADVNKFNRWGSTPMFKASVEGQLEVVKFLIQIRADVNKSYRDKFQNSPLVWAVRGKHYQIAELLVLSGAKIHTNVYFTWYDRHVRLFLGHLLFKQEQLKLQKDKFFEFLKYISKLPASDPINSDFFEVVLN
jgi:ankyrin repeat protein